MVRVSIRDFFVDVANLDAIEFHGGYISTSGLDYSQVSIITY